MIATGTSGNGCHAVRVAAAVLPIAGVLCLGYLVWGLRFRLNTWAAWHFVVPIWVAAAAAVAGSVSARVVSRHTPGRAPLRGLRALLWSLLLIVFLWAWFPPAERLVGWWVRQLTMFRFG